MESLVGTEGGRGQWVWGVRVGDGSGCGELGWETAVGVGS